MNTAAATSNPILDAGIGVIEDFQADFVDGGLPVVAGGIAIGLGFFAIFAIIRNFRKGTK